MGLKVDTPHVTWLINSSVDQMGRSTHVTSQEQVVLFLLLLYTEWGLARSQLSLAQKIADGKEQKRCCRTQLVRECQGCDGM